MDPHQRAERIPPRRSSHHGSSLAHLTTSVRCRCSSQLAAGTLAVGIPVYGPRRTGHAEPRDLP
jgi:hypothetical protein